MKTRQVRRLNFEQHGDERGHLVVAEGMKDIPFRIKRIFIFMIQMLMWLEESMQTVDLSLY